MTKGKSLLFLFGILLVIGSCSSGGSDSPPTGNDTQLYDVTVSMSPSDGGNISPSADSSYEDGSEVDLQATPTDAYTFSGWTGTIDTTANPVSITVDKDYNLTANFQIKSYELSVTTNGEGTVTEKIVQQKTDYEHGTVVELTAKPAEGWKFVEWQGDVTGTENPAQITVNDPKSVTAVFEKKSYALTVNTTGEGAVAEEVVQAKATDYEFGTTVELTANPSTGWKFVEWQGDLTGTQNPAQITVDTAKTVTAVFEKKTYAVNISTSGEGTVSKTPDQAEYEYNSNVDLTANPIYGWKFVEWQGDVTSTTNPLTITVDTTKNITAVFEKKSYELTINTTGEGTVSEEIVKAKSYEFGTTVELTANPAKGWQFVEWQGDLTGSTNPEQITIENPTTVTAVFEKKTYTVNVSTTGEGTVSKSPDQVDYEYNSNLDLTATPSTGWQFVEWQGDVSSTTNPLTVTVDTTKNITAVFEKKSFTLTINISGNGSVSKNPDQTEYEYGTLVDLTANPDAGWEFETWDGDTISTNNPITVSIDSAITLTAIFTNPTFAGGNGTQEYPYEVSTLDQLQAVRDYSSSHFIQINDIDASSTSTWNGGAGFIPIGDNILEFRGTFDRNGFFVNNIFINRGSENQIGLFGHISGAIVQNLNLTNVDITGYNNVGGITGTTSQIISTENIRSVVKNVTVTGTITGNDAVGGVVGISNYTDISNASSSVDVSGNIYVGGINGYFYSSVISNSNASGIITGTEYIGGLIGYIYRGNNSIVVNNSHSNTEVTGDLNIGGLVGYLESIKVLDSSSEGSASGNSYIGGLVGLSQNGILVNTHSSANISGTGDGTIGGLVGLDTGGEINRSSATGSVTGTKLTGGLVGHSGGVIKNSFSTGQITGTVEVGGLVGRNEFNSVIASYALGDVDGQESVGGLVGSNGSLIENSYSTGIVSGSLDLGGFIGSNGGTISLSYWDTQASNQTIGVGRGDSSGITGLTTSEMTGTSAETNMSAFDFVNIWVTNSSYPALFWE